MRKNAAPTEGFEAQAGEEHLPHVPRAGVAVALVIDIESRLAVADEDAVMKPGCKRLAGRLVRGVGPGGLGRDVRQIDLDEVYGVVPQQRVLVGLIEDVVGRTQARGDVARGRDPGA